MKVIEARDFNSSVSVAIVVSRFNPDITNELLHGAVERLLELEVPKDNLTVIHVPGVVEIPIVGMRLAQSQQYDAIIALGAVIRGDTDHYEYVCQQVSQGCQGVMLAHLVPVVFGVLTTQNVDQAKERIGGKKGHKGRDSADTAVEMMSIMSQLDQGA
jgi:6,7-dimethyl-8-ribityllumazine synthase